MHSVQTPRDEEEMSMDEILASIRRYVATDDQEKGKSSPSSQQPLYEPIHASYKATPAPYDEVVVLQDPKPAIKNAPMVSEETHTSHLKENYVSSPSYARSSSEQEHEKLLSEQSYNQSLQAFSKLKETVKMQSETQIPVVETASAQLNNPTLDQLFASIARPLIRDWIDKNLPHMVERMVAKEIERLMKELRS